MIVRFGWWVDNVGGGAGCPGRWWAAAAVAVLAGCGSDSEPVLPPPAPLQPQVQFQPCPEAPQFECGTLVVPLDHADPAGATLALGVRRTPNAGAPRGVGVWLSGGPGQGGQLFLQGTVGVLPPAVNAAYQWVAIDTRGTGDTALHCPALQAEVGASDLRPASVAAIEACAQALGPQRQFYSTADTVADLDWLRRALGVDSLLLNGVSYGTYVASVYAVTYPERVSALVLDSAVPHTGLDLFMRPVFQAVPDSLRGACQDVDCGGDPVAALATLVARDDDPVTLLDTLVTASVMWPGDPDLATALVDAAAGDAADLALWQQEARDAARVDAIAEFSSGLHIATLCQDMVAPWGDSATPRADRSVALAQAAAAVPEGQLWPFDQRTMLGNGALANCLHWPETPPGKQPRTGPLPDVPTLILAGANDLSTPPSEAQRQLELAPGGRLVVLPELGHSVQSSRDGLLNVINFLCDSPYPYPVPDSATFPVC